MLALPSHAAVRQTGLPAPSAGHTQELIVWCDDMDAAIARLRAARAPVLVEPYDHVAGHRRPTSPIPTATGWPSSRSNFRVTGQAISFAWAASRLVAGARPVMDPRFTRGGANSSVPMSMDHDAGCRRRRAQGAWLVYRDRLLGLVAHLRPRSIVRDPSSRTS